MRPEHRPRCERTNLWVLDFLIVARPSTLLGLATFVVAGIVAAATIGSWIVLVLIARGAVELKPVIQVTPGPPPPCPCRRQALGHAASGLSGANLHTDSWGRLTGAVQRGGIHRACRTPRASEVMIRVLLVDDQPPIRSRDCMEVWVAL